MASPRPALGQHFLLDSRVLSRIAQVIPLAGKTVIEIGAGHGELTAELASRAKKVIAIEFDHSLFNELEGKAGAWGNVAVIGGDALLVDFSPYRFFFGNLPYYLSSPLVFKVLAADFSDAVFLVQEEFGKRMMAEAGTAGYSRLSVAVQSRAACELTEFVPRQRFSPEPRVDSVVVHLKALAKKERTEYDPQLVSAAFSHKNQLLEKALVHSSHILGMKKEEVKGRVRTLLGAWAGKRVRTLAIREWGEISSAWNEREKGTSGI